MPVGKNDDNAVEGWFVFERFLQFIIVFKKNVKQKFTPVNYERIIFVNHSFRK